VTDNELNYHESFNTPIVDDFGLYTDNQIQPLVYKTPYELTLGFLDMIIDLNITDKNGLYSYMLFTTDEIELTFYIDTILDLNANTNKNGNSNSQAILYEIK